MKIVVIHNFYPPLSRGGASTVVAKQVHDLRRDGHEVVVVSLAGRKGDRVATEKSVHRVNPRNVYHPLDDHEHGVVVRLLWWFVCVFNGSVAREVGDILKKEKPDLVWTHNLYGLSFQIPRVIRKLNLKHKHTVHDLQLVYPSGVLLWGQEDSFVNTFFLRKWYERLQRKFWGSPTEVVFPSKWIKQEYEKRGFFGGSEKKVVQNFVPRHLGQLKGGTRLLYVGQVEEHKGVLFLIEVFRKLKGEPWCLDIVGDGSSMVGAKELAQRDGRVHFHGFQTGDALGKYYNETDVVMVPSLVYENAPTVIYESFGHGKPVCAARIGGVPELVKEGENGWLFEPGNSNDLVQKLAQIQDS